MVSVFNCTKMCIWLTCADSIYEKKFELMFLIDKNIIVKFSVHSKCQRAEGIGVLQKNWI